MVSFIGAPVQGETVGEDVEMSPQRGDDEVNVLRLRRDDCSEEVSGIAVTNGRAKRKGVRRCIFAFVV